MSNRDYMIIQLPCEDDEDATEQIRVPVVYEVCPGCHGKGTHVHRGIDGNGLTHEDFAEDPDFAEDYFAGRYDVTCEDCGGERVIGCPDYDKLSPELLKRIEEKERIEAQWRAEDAYQRRYGY